MHARRSIILPLLYSIELANSVEDLEKTSSCDQGINVCFIYNSVGKLYFQIVDKKSVKLLNYIFQNH